MRRGFAWYEMIFVLVAAGSITGIAVPRYEAYKREVAAEAVLEDLETVRSAVFRFYSDSGYFPPASGFALPPEALVRYLPAGFGFQRPYGTLVYKNWPVTTPSSQTSASNIIGVALVTKDARIGAAAAALYIDKPKFAVGASRVFIFFGV